MKTTTATMSFHHLTLRIISRLSRWGASLWMRLTFQRTEDLSHLVRLEPSPEVELEPELEEEDHPELDLGPAFYRNNPRHRATQLGLNPRHRMCPKYEVTSTKTWSNLTWFRTCGSRCRDCRARLLLAARLLQPLSPNGFLTGKKRDWHTEETRQEP